MWIKFDGDRSNDAIAARVCGTERNLE
jgi:hypothetical protein